MGTDIDCTFEVLHVGYIHHIPNRLFVLVRLVRAILKEYTLDNRSNSYGTWAASASAGQGLTRKHRFVDSLLLTVLYRR